MEANRKKRGLNIRSPKGVVEKRVFFLFWIFFLSISLSGCFWIVESPVEDHGENREASEDSPEEGLQEDVEEDSYHEGAEDPGENPMGDSSREPVQIAPSVETRPNPNNSDLKIPEEPVEFTGVDENFPQRADVLKEETLTSEDVIAYFEEKYGHYGGSFVIHVSLAPDTYEQGGNLYHQNEVYYTLTRKEDDRVIGKEVFRQVYREVSLNPPIMNNLDGEYNRVVENDRILREIEEQVIGRLNDARVEQGLSALSTASDLTRLARIKSMDMGLYNYFSHESPTYGGPFDMGRDLGVELRSENIQWATWELSAEEIHSNFMNSPGHRDNRMTPAFTEVGLGVIKLENGYYVTELFR